MDKESAYCKRLIERWVIALLWNSGHQDCWLGTHLLSSHAGECHSSWCVHAGSMQYLI